MQNAKIIAMAGKGGTGKTTISALVIKYLLEKNLTPVLAVDADPNANLNELLGIDVGATLGDIREDMRTKTPEGMSKHDYMEMQINQAILEATGYDLVVMGQPQGPGCYCMANSILAGVLERLSHSYKFLLVDNEAGMEHLSRLNLRNIYKLIVVSDASSRGVTAAKRIADLTASLDVKVEEKILIVNRIPDNMPEELIKHIEKTVSESDLKLGGFVPYSQPIFEYEAARKSILDIPNNADGVKETMRILEKFIGNP